MKTFLQPLTAREEREYLRQYKEGDREARNVLISRNMRLVAHVIKKYQNSGYETEDLLSVGTIGLIKAVDSYNMEKGSRLATYAARCVENEVLMLFRAGKKFSKEVSIYDPIGTDKDGETVSLMDILEMEGKEAVEQVILKEDVRKLYEAYEQNLKDTEKTVIRLRYGLFGSKEHTQREIAGQLGSPGPTSQGSRKGLWKSCARNFCGTGIRRRGGLQGSAQDIGQGPHGSGAQDDGDGPHLSAESS